MRDIKIIDRILTFLRRVGLIIAAVLALAVITLLLLFPTQVGDALDAINGFLRLVLIIALDAGLLYLIYMQIRALSGANHDGLIVKTGDSVTEINAESVQERIQKAISDVPNVAGVTVKVLPVRGRAKVALNVNAHDSVRDLPAMQKEIDKALHQTVRKQLGIALAGRPHIQIDILEGVTAPLSPPPVQPPSALTPSTEKVDKGLSEHKSSGMPQREQSPAASATGETKEDIDFSEAWAQKPEASVASPSTDNAVDVKAASTAPAVSTQPEVQPAADERPTQAPDDPTEKPSA